MKKNVGDSLESLLGVGNDSDEEDSKVVTCPPPLTTIKITAVALEKMFILAEEVFRVFEQALEVYCLCVGNNGVIEDILVPRQEVSFASVSIDPEHIMEISEIIRAKKLTILGWSHSHSNFNVFFSGVDDKNQTTLLAETSNFLVIQNVKIKYVYGMTVNIHHHYFGVVSTQYSCGRVEHYKAQFEIVDDLPADWDAEAFRSQIYDEIAEKVTSRHTGWWHHKSNKHGVDEKFAHRNQERNLNKNPEQNRIRDIMKSTIDNGQVINGACTQSSSEQTSTLSSNPQDHTITHPFDKDSQDTTKPMASSKSTESAKIGNTELKNVENKSAESKTLEIPAKPIEISTIVENNKSEDQPESVIPAKNIEISAKSDLKNSDKVLTSIEGTKTQENPTIGDAIILEEPRNLAIPPKPIEILPNNEITKTVEHLSSQESVKSSVSLPISDQHKPVEPSTNAESEKIGKSNQATEPKQPIELQASASPVNPNFITPQNIMSLNPAEGADSVPLPLIEEFLLTIDISKYNPKELLSLFVQFLNQKKMIVNKVENIDPKKGEIEEKKL